MHLIFFGNSQLPHTHDTAPHISPRRTRHRTVDVSHTQIVKEIGKGAFGTVFLVKHKDERRGDVIPLVLKKVKLAVGSFFY